MPKTTGNAAGIHWKNWLTTLAHRVKRTGRKALLEPMNPYERKIVHEALQNEPGIVTYSEGEEPYRKVVIDLK